MKVGDTVGITINVPGNENDEDKTNQREVVFREVKYVIFADDLREKIKDGPLVKFNIGTSDWEIRSRTAASGANSMDSGYKKQQPITF